MLCVVTAWAILFVSRDAIVAMFAATGETAELVRFFWIAVAGGWIFHGVLYVANSAFNNLGVPLLATGFNWAKATIGTIPFAMAGAQMGGAKGALVGQRSARCCSASPRAPAHGVVARLTRKVQQAEPSS